MVQILLNGNVMNAARRAAAKGEKIEYRDTLMPGLVIRVRSATPYFYWLSKNKKLKIGAITSFVPEDLEMLRGLIPVLQNALKEGENLNAIVTEIVLKGEKSPKNARTIVQEKQEVADGDGWTWKMARDNYLKFLYDENREASYRGNISALGCYEDGPIYEDFKDILNMPMKSITEHDLSAILTRIRTRIQDRNPKNINAGYDQTRISWSGIQSVFKYAAAVENNQRSGLKRNLAKLVPSPKKKTPKKGDVQAKAYNVRILANPKQISNLLKKDIFRDDISEPVRWALYLQILTGQRISTILTAHKEDFIRDNSGDWIYFWRLGPDKKDRYRLLPLPERASFAVSMALKIGSKENNFLFPKLRKKLAAHSRDGAMSKKPIYNRLSAIKEAGTSLPADFKGTHDFRRAFVSHLSPKWKTLGFESVHDIEMVTHKDEGRDTVAQAVYNKDDFILQKYRVLKAYEDLIFYDEELPKAEKNDPFDEYKEAFKQHELEEKAEHYLSR